MCREKGAVRHDDRIDALAQGVKWYTDAFAISANAAIAQRKADEWSAHLQAWMEDPQQEANHMVLGLSANQRQKSGTKSIKYWV